MGLIRRNKSGRFIGGSKLNVPGQGIYTVVRQPNDKLTIGPKLEPPYVVPEPTPKQKDKIPITPTPTPTPTPSFTPTPTPTPTPIEICYLATEDLIIIGCENGDNLIVDCP